MTNEEKNPSTTTTTTAKTNNDTTTTSSSENHQKIANNEQSKAKNQHQLTASTTPSPPIIKINRSPTKTASSNDDTDDLKSRCSFFRRAIPVMPKSLAIACCIMNILFPGLGTLVSSFSVFFCASHRYDTNLKAFLINLLAFFMQLFSAIIIFGWVWSIKYGLLFVHLADKTENIDMEPDLPLFVRRHSSMETNYLTKPRLSVIALAKVNEDEPI